MIDKQLRGDRIIAFAVMIQSLLLVMQTVMIGFFHMSADSTTIYRVVLTAIPMIIAMVIALVRNPVRFIIGYVLVIVLLVFTIAIFPDNTPFVKSQGMRFLLPVVVPSFLCLTVVYDYQVVEDTLYVISWFTMALVLLYVFGFFSGIVFIDSYNMAFSFACVLPFVVFYSHRKIYDKIVCLVLFVLVLAIGARGPALCMALYVILDMFQHKSRGRFFILLFIVVFIILLPLLNNWLFSIGISSRSLNMLLYGDISSDSGRSSLRAYFISKLVEHPFLGIGLFGDRLLEDIPYCHNLILEIVLDFGIPVGGTLLVIGLVKLISIYFKVDSDDRNRILRYFCALVLPFMTSGSYLISSNLAIFLGLCFLINKQNNTYTDEDIAEG